MASISQRGDSWWARIRCLGQNLIKTFDTKEDAQRWADAEEARIRKGETALQVQNMPSSFTVPELFDRYSKEVSPSKGGARWEIIRLHKIGRDFPTMAAIDLDGATLAEWRDKRLCEVSPSSVNRELNLVSAVYTRAIKEWRLPVKVNPAHMIEWPKKPRPRRRRVPDNERADILAQLGWDGKRQPIEIKEWVAWSFCLALETMMRQGEILNLTWEHVHLDRKFCYLPKTKNGDDRKVPLSSLARSLFGLIEETAPCNRVVDVNAGTFGVYFRKALKDANVVDLHFHDTRREALTRTSKKITNIAELARASGHRGTASLMVYYEPDITEIADKLD